MDADEPASSALDCLNFVLAMPAVKQFLLPSATSGNPQRAVLALDRISPKDQCYQYR